MDPEHRKIELQSTSDLTYITSLIRAAASQKLDASLPPVSDTQAEPDDLRRKTGALVDAFVDEVLLGLRANVSVNGMDVSSKPGDAMDLGRDGEGAGADAEEEYEDLDNKLREKLRSTIARRDALISRIATHRRQTAAVASQRFVQDFGVQMQALERENAELEERARKVVGVQGAVGLKRQEDVERSWEGAVLGLQRLNQGLPETRARLERAGDVVGYLEGGR